MIGARRLRYTAVHVCWALLAIVGCDPADPLPVVIDDGSADAIDPSLDAPDRDVPAPDAAIAAADAASGAPEGDADPLPPWERQPLEAEAFDDLGHLDDCLPPAEWTPPEREAGPSPDLPAPIPGGGGGANGGGGGGGGANGGGGGDGGGGGGGGEPPPVPPEPWGCASGLSGDLIAVDAPVPLVIGPLRRPEFDLLDERVWSVSTTRIRSIDWQLESGPDGADVTPRLDEGAIVFHAPVAGPYTLRFWALTDGGLRVGDCTIDAVEPTIDPVLPVEGITPADVHFDTIPRFGWRSTFPVEPLYEDAEVHGEVPWPVTLAAPLPPLIDVPFSAEFHGFHVWSFAPDGPAPRVGERLTFRLPVRYSTRAVDRVAELEVPVLDDAAAPETEIEDAALRCHAGRPALYVRFAEPVEGDAFFELGRRGHFTRIPLSLDGPTMTAIVTGLDYDPTPGVGPLWVRFVRGDVLLPLLNFVERRGPPGAVRYQTR